MIKKLNDIHDILNNLLEIYTSTIVFFSKYSTVKHLNGT